MPLRRSSRHRISSAIVVLMMPLLFACGSDDETADTTTSTIPSSSMTTSESSTTTTDPTTSESTTTTAGPTTTSDSTTTTTATTGSSTTTGTGVVTVYFSTGDGTDCSEVTAFERDVDGSIGPALAAFNELVGGPTPAEEAAGASSFFSSATADAVLSVTQRGGVLTVDFEDIRAEISNAGTSCGSAAFTSSLNATAFQFPAIDGARYLFAGSCEDFGAFIQTDSCEFQRNG